jgi:TATA-box binding protein (TBP) (component of TFIID and TFIIIB)
MEDYSKLMDILGDDDTNDVVLNPRMVKSVMNTRISTFFDLLENISAVDIPVASELRVSTRSAICKMSCSLNLENLCRIFRDRIESKDADIRLKGIEYKDAKRDIYIEIGLLKKKKYKKAVEKDAKKKRKTFSNQATIAVYTNPDRNPVNVKLFTNNSISMTGCKVYEDGLIATQIIKDEIMKIPNIFESEEDKNNFNFYNYEITMINSDFSVGFKIDAEKLYDIIVSKYKIFVVFEPIIHPGVKISYYWNQWNVENDKPLDGHCYCSETNKCIGKGKGHGHGLCKKITIIVFKSGKIIITGSRFDIQSSDARDYICKLLHDNYADIVRFSISDCADDIITIRVKKNKNTKQKKISDYM